MKAFFAVLVALHGLIHLMGPAKAFGWAELPQLTQPISRPVAFAWLAAAILCLATAAALYLWPSRWWLLAGAAALVSQAVIFTSWTDAKVGTLANVVILIGAGVGLLTQGPGSLRARFDQAVAGEIAPGTSNPVLTEAAIAHLPPPVQRYLRVTGAVGRPVPRNVRASWRGRIRGTPTDRWMPLTAVQVNKFDPPSRHFLMDATMFAVPVQAFHQYTGAHATMLVKLAGLHRVADQAGPEMDLAETVTLFNDMCVLAPATLTSAAIQWHPVDDRTARATFTNQGHTISAELTFNADGELTDFVSDDRFRGGLEGQTFVRTRWSTPLSSYRDFGSARLAAVGAGHWHPPAGGYSYIEIELLAVDYDVVPAR